MYALSSSCKMYRAGIEPAASKMQASRDPNLSPPILVFSALARIRPMRVLRPRLVVDSHPYCFCTNRARAFVGSCTQPHPVTADDAY